MHHVYNIARIRELEKFEEIAVQNRGKYAAIEFGDDDKLLHMYEFPCSGVMIIIERKGIVNYVSLLGFSPDSKLSIRRYKDGRIRIP